MIHYQCESEVEDRQRPPTPESTRVQKDLKFVNEAIKYEKQRAKTKRKTLTKWKKDLKEIKVTLEEREEQSMRKPSKQKQRYSKEDFASESSEDSEATTTIKIQSINETIKVVEGQKKELHEKAKQLKQVKKQLQQKRKPKQKKEYRQQFRGRRYDLLANSSSSANFTTTSGDTSSNSSGSNKSQIRNKRRKSDKTSSSSSSTSSYSAHQSSRYRFPKSAPRNKRPQRKQRKCQHKERVFMQKKKPTKCKSARNLEALRRKHYNVVKRNDQLNEKLETEKIEHQRTKAKHEYMRYLLMKAQRRHNSKTHASRPMYKRDGAMSVLSYKREDNFEEEMKRIVELREDQAKVYHTYNNRKKKEESSAAYVPTPDQIAASQAKAKDPASSKSDVNVLEYDKNGRDKDHRPLLDTGATHHVTPYLGILKDIKETNIAQIRGITGRIDVKVEGTLCTLPGDDLKGVLYLKSAARTVISLGKLLDQHGGRVILESKHAVHVADNGTQTTLGPKTKEGWYRIVRLPKSQEAEILALNTGNQLKREQIMRLHRNLGHISANQLRLVLAKQPMLGLLPQDVKLMTKCTACALGKPRRTSNPKSRKRVATKFGEVVHTDNTGEQPVRTYDGKRVGNVVVDEYSNWVFATPLRSKAESVQRLRYIIEQELDKQTKVIHSDQGGEFMEVTMGQLCKDTGARQETSATQNSQQNGKAEKAIQDVMRDTRAVLADSGMALKFWGEAFQYAAHTKNRKPCASNSDFSTPYFLRFQVDPNYDRMQPFGQHCTVMYPKQRLPYSKKLGNQSRPGRMLGYDDDRGTKAYRVFVPTENKVIISNDVTFLDEGGVTSQQQLLPDVSTIRETPPPKPPIQQHDNANTNETAHANPTVQNRTVQNRTVQDRAVQNTNTQQIQQLNETTAATVPVTNTATANNNTNNTNANPVITVPANAADAYNQLEAQQQTGQRQTRMQTRNAGRPTRQWVRSNSLISLQRANNSQTDQSSQSQTRTVSAPSTGNTLSRLASSAIESTASAPTQPRRSMRLAASAPSQPQPRRSARIAASSSESVADVEMIELDREITDEFFADHEREIIRKYKQAKRLKQDKHACLRGCKDAEPKANKQVKRPMSEAEVYTSTATKSQNLATDVFTPVNHKQAATCADKDKWNESEQRELKSMKDFKVYKKVKLNLLPKGTQVLDSKWVYKVKPKEDGTVSRYKSRVVVRGDQKRDKTEETYSPVATATTIRFILALTVTLGLFLRQTDFNTAFLNAKITNIVAVRAPPGTTDCADDEMGSTTRTVRPS